MSKEVEIQPDHIAQLMRGERPEEMGYNEFKLKRKAINYFLKNRKKGVLFHEGPGQYKKIQD